MTNLVHKYATEGQIVDWFKVYVTMMLDVPFHFRSVYEYMTRVNEVDHKKFDWNYFLNLMSLKTPLGSKKTS